MKLMTMSNHWRNNMKVAVIGAGTSGLICAYKLRKRGFDVFLFDKNEKVGRKWKQYLSS